MADLFHHFPIKARVEEVFRAASTPSGLDAWWTKLSSGVAEVGSEYKLWFGPEHDWRATVTKSEPNRAFELEMTRADGDWLGTRVGFELEGRGEFTDVEFAHAGWPEANEHFHGSNYCWAMYLRLLKRFVEFGEVVPYEKRLDA